MHTSEILFLIPVVLEIGFRVTVIVLLALILRRLGK